MEVAGFIASIAIGVSLGLIGGGGSILTVPVLVYLFGVDAVLATAYSLFIVGWLLFLFSKRIGECENSYCIWHPIHSSSFCHTRMDCARYS
jgi:hypothetical protein